MEDTYISCSRAGESVYKEKGSKFYGFAFHVTTKEEVKKRLEFLRKKYSDARHVCYAYSLGLTRGSERANDDDEPAHSAGTPILNQIYSAETKNTLVAVVRYFGGTKLGVSGLIHAYKTAAKEALIDSSLKEYVLHRSVRLTSDYENSHALMQLIKKNELNIVSQDSGLKMSVVIEIRLSLIEAVESQLNKQNRIIFETLKH